MILAESFSILGSWPSAGAALVLGEGEAEILLDVQASQLLPVDVLVTERRSPVSHQASALSVFALAADDGVAAFGEGVGPSVTLAVVISMLVRSTTALG